MQTKSNNFALVALTALFFVMGFITVLNDILIPHLKVIFELNHFESALVQFCFFGAYFVTGGVFGKLLEKIGYPVGIVLGFILTAIGCVLFYPAASMASYSIFLGAFFILASGVVLLQTAGNPFVTLLAPGKEATALTLVQAFNSLGTTLGPIFGAAFILSDTVKYASKLEEAQSVQIPYLAIAGILILLAIVIYLLKLPDIRKRTEVVNEENYDKKESLFEYPHFVLGAAAIFFYVGAEVSIGSFLILTMEKFANIKEITAAKYIVYYWGGAMIGRFIGSFIMTKIAPNKCLAFNSIINICLIIIAILIGGKIAMIALLVIGLFNSIMFPTIFSLATKKLGKFTSRASGLISMAIVGGALIPPVQGLVADYFNLLISYIVPLLCYFYILFFAFRGYKTK
ncbi:sugar MFS transporter [Campylobacter sp. LH-2024]|uniref:sugar MFS transporter n=1 Tax=Campylobacter TaxID=194 RepID=UPI001D7668AA|nr:sugar MFS transporter [Campylobacter sp. W0067]MBZ7938094.1 sugar MFS transporter [Campylobacter sp. RM10538]MBZ7945841.1 sugar MFS transporter [Campylobacter sp. RM10532]MBZ7950225.1 sugar MFS transporter [Campylobacter sp. RM10534]MBZ7951686.1 sugar MFS transporter [Campylobacter sp. W0046]MBZ7961917.1 sugar MFS transporter [Campylobacter sp. RM9930]MBZ7963367.1 sugar MFS transporter [Campylobacter sp. W0049]MBZ7969366.1 sugar MFS transporter [Campylobacter sp. RM9759]